MRFASLLTLLAVTPALADDAPANPHARWESAIEKFEQADAKNPPEKGGVLFVGSSSIRLWKLDESFPKLGAANRGFGGSEIADSTHFADRIVTKHEPRVVVLYAGDNDVAKGKSPERVHGDFNAFVKTVHAELPETRIVYVAIKPSIKRWSLVGKMRRANALIAKECEKDDRLAFVDVDRPMLGDDGKPRAELFLADGLHLNEKGYALWTKLVRPHLSATE